MLIAASSELLTIKMVNRFVVMGVGAGNGVGSSSLLNGTENMSSNIEGGLIAVLFSLLSCARIMKGPRGHCVIWNAP
jgi:hypothetical protein